MLLLTSALACPSPAIAADPDVGPEDIVTFATSIDPDSVDAFIAAVGERPVKRIVVTSVGGEITAGMRLGNWIVDRGLDVEVRGLCASSCANYLFTAGRHRIIDEGGIVIWHGSALQANFRSQRADCPRRIRELEHAGGDLVDRYQAELAEAEQTCEYFMRAAEQQAAFFARIGVDETITRLGQEPYDFGAPWTVTITSMKRFGMPGIEASADYGSHAYLAPFSRALDTTIVTLGVDASGAVVEEAR